MKALGVLLWGTAVSGMDVVSGGSGPVAKVVRFLKDMQTELQKDAEKDEEIFSKLNCWCKDNQREMEKSTAAAQNTIAQLQASVENLSGKIGGLQSEIANLKTDIEKNKESLSTAKAVHDKELASFSEEEKDMAQSISALKAAITVLEKHNTGFIQNANELSKSISHHATTLGKEITQKQIEHVIAFLKKPAAFLQGNAQAPASGEIFGILKQMLETFETNLETSRKENAASTASYQELSASKSEELKDNEQHLALKEEEYGKAIAKKADDQENLEQTESTLSADEKFLLEVKTKCAASDDEFEARQQTRSEEMVAVAKAIEILSSDASFDTFSNSVGQTPPSFIQVQDSKSRKEASVMLEKIAAKYGDPKIMLLASSVKLDAFTKVIGAIEALIHDLKNEQANEVQQKDWCVDEFHTNELTQARLDDEIEGLEAEAENLKNTVNTLETEIEALQAEIKEAEKNIKILGSDRAQENREYQDQIIHNREAQRILKHAKQVLEAYYRQNNNFVQTAEKQEPLDERNASAPEGPAEFKKNTGGNVVINMIQQVIKDSELAVTEATAADSNAQRSYEETVMDTNAMIATKQENMDTKTGQKGEAESDLSNCNEDLEAKKRSHIAARDEDQVLHQRCDFLLKNFDLRQQHRMDEMDALREAKAILQGMQ